jgi:hypothetical protein
MCTTYFPCLISKESDLTPKMERKCDKHDVGKEGKGKDSEVMKGNEGQKEGQGVNIVSGQKSKDKCVHGNNLEKGHRVGGQIPVINKSHSLKDMQMKDKPKDGKKCNHGRDSSKKRIKARSNTIEDVQRKCGNFVEDMHPNIKMKNGHEKPAEITNKPASKIPKKFSSSSESEVESEASQVFNFTPKSLDFLANKKMSKGKENHGNKYPVSSSLSCSVTGSPLLSTGTGSRSHDALDSLRIQRPSDPATSSVFPLHPGSAFSPYLGHTATSKSNDELLQKPLKTRQRVEKPNPNFQYCEKPTFEKPQAPKAQLSQPSQTPQPSAFSSTSAIPTTPSTLMTHTIGMHTKRPKSASAVRSVMTPILGCGKSMLQKSFSTTACSPATTIGIGPPSSPLPSSSSSLSSIATTGQASGANKPVLCASCRPKSAHAMSRSSSGASAHGGHSHSHSRSGSSCSNISAFSKVSSADTDIRYKYYYYQPPYKTQQQPQYPDYHYHQTGVPDSLTQIGSSKTLPSFWSSHKFPPSKLSITNMGSLETPGLHRKMDTIKEQPRKVSRSKSLKASDNRGICPLPPHVEETLLGKPRKLERSASMTVAAAVVERCRQCGQDSNLTKIMEMEVKMG